jgi:predicted transcriptional regulator
MAKQFKAQLREAGYTDDQLRADAYQKGVEPIAADWGRSIETVRRHLEDELQILDAPLFTKAYADTHFKVLPVVVRETLVQVFEIWKEMDRRMAVIEAENKTLRGEAEKIDQSAKDYLFKVQAKVSQYRQSKLSPLTETGS